MKHLRIPLRVVFYREDEVWVAHCLEFDLLGDGATQSEALAQLDEAISLQVEATVESGNFDNLFRPAPGKYLKMFASGDDVAVGGLHLQVDSVEISETRTREYVAG